MGCWTGLVIIGKSVSNHLPMQDAINQHVRRAVSHLRKNGHDVELSFNFDGDTQERGGLSTNKALILIEADSPTETVPLTDIKEQLEATLTKPLSGQGYQVERFVIGPAEHVIGQ